MSATAIIVGATNASPIVLATAYAHGFLTGDTVAVSGVQGNVAANQSGPIAVVDATHFEFPGSIGNGVYVPSGIARALNVTQSPQRPIVGGFGRDLSGIGDLDPAMLEVDGSGGDPLILGQALCRRLSTPRAGLVGDPNYGLDLTSSIGDDFTNNQISQLAASINAECRKDERVLDCASSLSYNQAAEVLTVTLSVTTSAGPFRFVLAVTDVTVALLRSA